MKVYRFDYKRELRYNIMDLRPNEYEIVLNALNEFRKSMNELISTCDEDTIDLDRMLNKELMSQKVRKCRLVVGVIDDLVLRAKNAKHVPVIEA